MSDNTYKMDKMKFICKFVTNILICSPMATSQNFFEKTKLCFDAKENYLKKKDVGAYRNKKVRPAQADVKVTQILMHTMWLLVSLNFWIKASEG